MPRFTPPTVEEGPMSSGPLFSRYKRTHGVTVLKTGGVYTQHRYPGPDEVEAADIVYVGGYDYEVSSAEAAALTAAGYTVT